MGFTDRLRNTLKVETELEKYCQIAAFDFVSIVYLCWKQNRNVDRNLPVHLWFHCQFDNVHQSCLKNIIVFWKILSNRCVCYDPCTVNCNWLTPTKNRFTLSNFTIFFLGRFTWFPFPVIACRCKVWLVTFPNLKKQNKKQKNQIKFLAGFCRLALLTNSSDVFTNLFQ